MILIQTTSPESARKIQSSPTYRKLLDTVRGKTKALHLMVAHNAKRIGDTSRGGLFLFNHFAADDTDVMSELWDYLAGWYVVETGLRNSIAMAPEPGEDSSYAMSTGSAVQEELLELRCA